MAYVSKELKANVAPVVKAILKKYKLKGSLSVRNHSTLVLTISAGSIDFVGNFNEQGPRSLAVGYVQVNEYHYDSHFTGAAKSALGELLDAMNVGNHDDSDYQTDYFSVGWYTNVNIGKWNKNYVIA